MNPILLYSPLYNETIEAYTNQLLTIDNNEESLTWINSPGGSVYAAWSLIGALKQREGKNKAVVMGQASSGAFYLLAFMDHVEAVDTANFTMHRADMYVYDEDDEKLINNVNKQIRAKLEKKIDKEEFEKVTGVSFDTVFSMDLRKDVHITAKQAKKLGIVDKIIKLEPREIAALNNITINTNINANKNQMIKNPFKKEFPQKSVVVGENTVLFRELSEGKGVEILNSVDAFTGDFEADNKKVSVVENKITAVVDVSEKDLKIKSLEDEITALKASDKELENSITDILADAKVEIETLKQTVTANSEILEKAKLSKSNPKLPAGEFKEEITAPVDEKSKKYKIQKDIEARAEEKMKAFREAQINGRV